MHFQPLLYPLVFILFFYFELSAQTAIDRYALVNRHTVYINTIDSLNALSVGNGNFCFTVGITGLQNFSEYYAKGIGLGTLSNWAWHSYPNPENYKLNDVLKFYEVNGRKIPYVHDFREEKTTRRAKASVWLRNNPHRWDLGKISFFIQKNNGEEIEIQDIKAPQQKLNLWTGEIESDFMIEGFSVRVFTLCHPEKDLISVKIISKLLEQARLKIKIQFAEADDNWQSTGAWGNPQNHQSKIIQTSSTQTLFFRQQDNDAYFVTLAYPNGQMQTIQPHIFYLSPNKKDSIFSFSAQFHPKKIKNQPEDFIQIQEISKNAWQKFWLSGGAIDFSACQDKRAKELERRAVLSQYLTKIQCSGKFPPAETGLTINSWHGKFHLEMHWWHSVHFALWQRPEILQKQIDFYFTIFDKAQATAQQQGYRGIRIPKMIDLSGRESPSTIGTYLIWQQPHLIYLSELLYQTSQNKSRILKKYQKLVFATAEFMADYPNYDSTQQKYILGPALIPAQERFSPENTLNPTFELLYWAWGLKTAMNWQEKLNKKAPAQWKLVYEKLAKLPIKDSLYLFAESAVDSYTNPKYFTDHPMVLACLGMLPTDNQIDMKIMENTFQKIVKDWHWTETWGWDYPMVAMTAAELNKSDEAIDILLMPVQKNKYLLNGHNYQDERLPLYLPGNGAFLTALAKMCTRNQFPQDGKWPVKWENLNNF